MKSKWKYQTFFLLPLFGPFQVGEISNIVSVATLKKDLLFSKHYFEHVWILMSTASLDSSTVMLLRI